MSERNRRVPPDEEPDFAEEHTKPTYEDESEASSSVNGDEAAPEGPAGEDPGDQRRPL